MIITVTDWRTGELIITFPRRPPVPVNIGYITLASRRTDRPTAPLYRHLLVDCLLKIAEARQKSIFACPNHEPVESSLLTDLDTAVFDRVIRKDVCRCGAERYINTVSGHHTDLSVWG